MSFRVIFLILLLSGLAINQSPGQIIADFTLDDDSNMPASLLINRVGEDAISINPRARSNGEGVYTLVDEQRPDVHQNVNLKVPESLLNQQTSIQLEFDFLNQEEFAWMIFSGFNRFRFGHHELAGGLHVRYATTADPTKIIESGYVGLVERGERAIVVFAYNHELGAAYILKNGRILWETAEEDRTPGASMVWETEDGFFNVGANMDGEGSTIPSLYRFRAYISLCLDNSPPIAENDSICGSGQAQLRASGGEEGQYRWYKGDGENFILIDGEVNSSYTTNTISSLENYYVSIATEECESALVPVQAVVNPVPDIPAFSYTPPCGPDELTVHIEGAQDGYTYSWYAAENSGIVQQGTSVTLEAARDTVIYVSANNGFCESELAPVHIYLNDLPAVDAGMDRTIMKGESVELLAAGDFASCRWTSHPSLQYPETRSPVVTPEFTHTYMVTAIGQNGCENTDTVTIYVLDKFPVPNAFSPNDDGQNDTWQIPNIEDYPDCKVIIFNRWGNQVFSSKGYREPWDGTHNGRPLPPGTYYYTLRLDNKQELVKGSVVIIR